MWKWLIVLESIFLLAAGCNNVQLGKCLQDAENHYASSLGGEEKLQLDGTVGITEARHIQLEQNLLQEKANCKVLY